MTVRLKHLIVIAAAVPFLLGGLGRCKEISSTTCLKLEQYTDADLKAAAAEYQYLEDHNLAPHLRAMVDDYIDTRSAIRKCIEIRDGKRK